MGGVLVEKPTDGGSAEADVTDDCCDSGLAHFSHLFVREVRWYRDRPMMRVR